VTNAMMEMGKVTQSNAAGAQESAAAAQDLSSQTGLLRDAVGRLNGFTGLKSNSHSFDLPGHASAAMPATPAPIALRKRLAGSQAVPVS
jgi:methyl-accepting chemotaxis protein